MKNKEINNIINELAEEYLELESQKKMINYRIIDLCEKIKFFESKKKKKN